MQDIILLGAKNRQFLCHLFCRPYLGLPPPLIFLKRTVSRELSAIINNTNKRSDMTSSFIYYMFRSISRRYNAMWPDIFHDSSIHLATIIDNHLTSRHLLQSRRHHICLHILLQLLSCYQHHISDHEDQLLTEGSVSLIQFSQQGSPQESR